MAVSLHTQSRGAGAAPSSSALWAGWNCGEEQRCGSQGCDILQAPSQKLNSSLLVFIFAFLMQLDVV